MNLLSKEQHRPEANDKCWSRVTPIYFTDFVGWMEVPLQLMSRTDLDLSLCFEPKPWIKNNGKYPANYFAFCLAGFDCLSKKKKMQNWQMRKITWFISDIFSWVDSIYYYCVDFIYNWFRNALWQMCAIVCA